MIVTYTDIKSQGYISGSDEYEEYGEDFDYEIDDEEVRECLAKYIYSQEFKPMFLNEDKGMKKLLINAIVNIIHNYDMQDKLEDDCYEIIKECFKKEAFASRED